jgi:hypothetical protein
MSSIRPYVYLDALKKRLTIIITIMEEYWYRFVHGPYQDVVNEYPKIPHVPNLVTIRTTYPGAVVRGAHGFNGCPWTGGRFEPPNINGNLQDNSIILHRHVGFEDWTPQWVRNFRDDFRYCEIRDAEVIRVRSEL